GCAAWVRPEPAPLPRCSSRGSSRGLPRSEPMAVERTLSILKPDALDQGVIGKIVTRFEESGLKPVAMKMMQLTRPEAEGFYAVHRERPFFKSLVEYMTSGPVIVQVLEGEN